MGGQKARVVVLGGGFAGVLAAKRVAKAMGGDVEVTLVSKTDAFIERVRFHEIAAGRPVQRWKLDALLAPVGATFVHGNAESIDPKKKSVRVALRTEKNDLAYDKLIYALGSAIDLDSCPGASEWAHSVADEAAARRLAKALVALPEGARVVVVGGGMTGVEVATEIAEAWPRLRLRLVTLEAPCEPLVDGARAHLRKILERMQVDVREGARVLAVEPSALAIEHAPSEPFDLCIWAASFKVPALARDAGLAVHPRGQLDVDEVLRSTSHADVWGAGDASLPTNTHAIRMGCATAMPMAAQCADNLVAELKGKTPEPFRFRYMARFISLGRSEALGQFTRQDDSPRGFFTTGLVAAWMKEATFKFNAFGIETGVYPGRWAF
jgi:NADH dehydrogenase